MKSKHTIDIKGEVTLSFSGIECVYESDGKERVIKVGAINPRHGICMLSFITVSKVEREELKAKCELFEREIMISVETLKALQETLNRYFNKEEK